MKNQLGIVFLATVALLCSCKNNRKIIVDGGDCVDIVQPANLKPIDWNGWNDAYTVGYTFYDNEEDASYEYVGDTIKCYGHIAKYIYEYDTPFSVNKPFYLEGSENQEDQQCVGICFNFPPNSNDADSVLLLLNNSTYSDTCFVKGNLGLYPNFIMSCYLVFPYIVVNRVEDIYFK